MVGEITCGKARYLGMHPSHEQMKTKVLHYTIYRKRCSNPEAVRKHLDSGVLATLLARKESLMLSSDEKPHDVPGYVLILLGACAMSLGCTIPPRFIATMRKVFKCFGLMEEAERQLDNALNGNDGFKSGEPYDFGSRGLMEAMRAADKQADSGYADCQIGVNVLPAVETMWYDSPKQTKALKELVPQRSTKALDELKAEYNESQYGHGVCGRCGAAERKEGGALLVCGKCRARKYCSVDCQKENWKLHKHLCKVSNGGKRVNDVPEQTEAEKQLVEELLHDFVMRPMDLD